MFSRTLVLAGTWCCALWLTTGMAEAKTIDMGALSRSSVKVACEQAGGRSFGIFDDNGAYGCRHARATILCAPDRRCEAAVSDLLPMAGNSLDTILGIAHSRPAAIAIQPVDARLYPVNP